MSIKYLSEGFIYLIKLIEMVKGIGVESMQGKVSYLIQSLILTLGEIILRYWQEVSL